MLSWNAAWSHSVELSIWHRPMRAQSIPTLIEYGPLSRVVEVVVVLVVVVTVEVVVVVVVLVVVLVVLVVVVDVVVLARIVVEVDDEVVMLLHLRSVFVHVYVPVTHCSACIVVRLLW